MRGTADLPQRNPFRSAWLVIRVPHSRHIGSVAINGKPWTAGGGTRSRIGLPKSKGRMEIVVKAR